MPPERPVRALSVVVPAYNEGDNLAGAVSTILEAGRILDEIEVLLVNDGSADHTGAVADRLAGEHPNVTAIHHPRNLGFAAAYHSGLTRATLPYFTFLPGDNEVAPESVRAIFDAIGQADLVVPYHGTPWRRAWHRRILTAVSVGEINLLFGWRMRYFQGPTVYSTDLARRLPVTTGQFFFVTEMLVHALRAGYSYVQVPLTHQERAYGRSKAVAVSNIINAEKTIFHLWWNIRVQGYRAVPRVGSSAALELREGVQL
ncbi:MAG: glycosyltransferase family 2 protein [Chloroflexi bacterium]|nr:glycosyltransferase family 2 protein [Chloroflexota bacterium]